jgi:hypothetical protein
MIELDLFFDLSNNSNNFSGSQSTNWAGPSIPVLLNWQPGLPIWKQVSSDPYLTCRLQVGTIDSTRQRWCIWGFLKWLNCSISCFRKLGPVLESQSTCVYFQPVSIIVWQKATSDAWIAPYTSISRHRATSGLHSSDLCITAASALNRHCSNFHLAATVTLDTPKQQL